LLDYQTQGNRVVIPLVETDPVRRGEGFADLLIAEVLDQIDRENSFVIPLCPFVVKHIADRPEHHHLLAPIED
jgi:predicted GNAT family acetyltransferase